MLSSFSQKLLIVLVAVIAVAAVYSYTTGTFSLREFLVPGLSGSGDGAPEPVVATAPAPRPPADTTTPALELDLDLDFDGLQKIVSVIDANQRKIILADAEAFRNFVTSEAVNKSVLAAAHANRIDEDERNLLLARRGTENILREIYLKKLTVSKIPAGFPMEEQVRAYYEQNRDKFLLEDRVHVWQIFLTIPAGADQKEVELLKKQAQAIITELNKNKLDFEAAARKYSQQTASKYNGGYMGLTKISELKPEIREPLMALAPGKISAPVVMEEGIHILKRGTLVPGQPLAYGEVAEQIKKLLVAQLENQIRQAVFKQAAETYPAGIDDKKIEEWRLKLRPDTTAGAAVSVAAPPPGESEQLTSPPLRGGD